MSNALIKGSCGLRPHFEIKRRSQTSAPLWGDDPYNNRTMTQAVQMNFNFEEPSETRAFVKQLKERKTDSI